MLRCFYCGGDHPSSSCADDFAEIFKLAHAEEMWIQERQLELLTGIHDMIKNLDATRANESFEMGVKALEVGMVKESIGKLQKSIKLNPLDYRAYVVLGHAYLLIDDYNNALTCFGYALKNGRTEIYQSFALLLIAQVKYCMGQIEDAIQASKKACDICPNFPEARYRYAIYMTAKKQNVIE